MNVIPMHNLKGKVRRKMNFTYVLGFVELRHVVIVFPVSSPSFARKTTRKNRARSHSIGGMTRPDDKVHWSRDHSCQSWPGLGRRHRSSRVLHVGQLLHLQKRRSFPVIYGSK